MKYLRWYHVLMLGLMLFCLLIIGGREVKSSEPIPRNIPDGTRVEINDNIAGKDALH